MEYFEGDPARDCSLALCTIPVSFHPSRRGQGVHEVAGSNGWIRRPPLPKVWGPFIRDTIRKWYFHRVFSLSLLIDVETEKAEIAAYVKAKKDTFQNNLLVVLVVPSKNDVRYPAFKTLLDLELAVCSQFVVLDLGQKKEDSRWMWAELCWQFCSKLRNISIAINIKAMAFTENACVPLKDLITAKTGIIGIDVYHAPPGSKRRSEAALSGR